MKPPREIGLIVTCLTLSFVGCEPPKGVPEPVPKVEHEAPAPSGGISTRVPPVEPSPVPSLPSTPKGDMDKKDEAKPAEKKGEEPAKVEPKAEPPK